MASWFLFRAFLVSLALHALVFGVLILLNIPKRRSLPASSIFVELKEDSGQGEGEQKSSRAGAALLRKSAVVKPPPAPFAGLNLRPRSAEWAEVGEPGADSDADGNKGPRSALNNPVAKSPATLETLYRRIDGWLTFPENLSRAEVKGRLVYTLEVRADGTLGPLLSAKENDRRLETWVKRGLRNLLAGTELPRPHSPFVAQLEFYLNDRFPEAAVAGTTLKFFRSDQRLGALTAEQTEASKAPVTHYRNREAVAEIRVDPAKLAHWLFFSGEDKKRAEERVLLEQELLEAEEKGRRAGEAPSPR